MSMGDYFSMSIYNIADVLFIYQNYKDFRQGIDYLYTEIVKRLRIKGLIE